MAVDIGRAMRVTKQQGSSHTGEGVQVMVRVRPFSAEETSSTSPVVVDEENGCIALNSSVVTGGSSKAMGAEGSKTYTFDSVCGPSVTQESIFEAVGKPATDSALSGFNSTIFAYGQTGAGKTFTIMGAKEEDDATESHFDETSRGLIPRVLEYLFERMDAMERESGGRHRFLCKCSFLEIYNENLTDLLNPSSGSLTLRENVVRGVHVEGMTEETLRSPDEAFQLLSIGESHRKVAATAMNSESSRSHSAFTLYIESRESSVEGVTTVRYSKFNIVDLAGSERQQMTLAAGERLREANSINKSLSSLGNVIMALTNPRFSHVPYRDSKLTFLLKDSLGGNSLTHIIAAVSPSERNVSETLSTLKFVQRAKLMKNKVVLNEGTTGSTDALQEEVRRLKEEIAALKQLMKSNGESVAVGNSTSRAVAAGAESGAGLIDEAGVVTATSLEETLKSRVSDLETIVQQTLSRESRLQEQVEEGKNRMSEMLKLCASKDKALQGSKMVMKLKESAVKALRKGEVVDEVALLEKEVAELKRRIENNPKVVEQMMTIRSLEEKVLNYEARYGDGEENIEGQLEMLKHSLKTTNDELRRCLGENKEARESVVTLQERDSYNASVIADLQEQLVRATAEVSEAIRARDVSNEAREKITKELLAAKTSAQSYLQQLEDSKRDLMLIDGERQENEERAAQAQVEVREAQSKTAELEGQLAGVSERISSMDVELQAEKDKMVAVQNETAEKMKSMKKSLSEKEEQINLQKEAAEITASQLREAREMEKRHEEEMEEQKRSGNVLREQFEVDLNALQVERDSLITELASAKQSIEILEVEVTDLIDQWDTAKGTWAQQQLDMETHTGALVQENAVIARALQEMETDKVEAEATIRDLEERLSLGVHKEIVMAAEMEDARLENEAIQTRLHSVEEEKYDLQDEVVSQKLQLASMADELKVKEVDVRDKMRLEVEMVEVQKQMSSLSSDNGALRQAIAQKDADLMTLQQDVSGLRQMESAWVEGEKERQCLQMQLTVSQEQASGLNEEINKVRQSNQTLRMELESSRRERDSATEDLAKAVTEAQKTREEVSNLRTSLSAAVCDLEEMTGVADGAKENLSELEGQLRSVEASQSEARSEIERKCTEIESRNAEIESLKKSLEDAQAESKGREAEKDERIYELEAQIEAIKAELLERNASMDDLEQQKAELVGKIWDMEKEMSSQKRKRASLDSYDSAEVNNSSSSDTSLSDVNNNSVEEKNGSDDASRTSASRKVRKTRRALASIDNTSNNSNGDEAQMSTKKSRYLLRSRTNPDKENVIQADPIAKRTRRMVC